MPRDKVALLINSCAKKPKPRRVAAVAPSAPRPARRVAQVELDAKAAEVAAPALATMDGSLHTLPSKPAAGLDDMDGSLYNLPAFG